MAKLKYSKAVEKLQREMQASGHYTGAIDGLAGSGYKKAIERRSAAADRSAKAADRKANTAVALAKAKAKEADANAKKADADARKVQNSPLTKIVGLGGQALAVGAGAYAGHSTAKGIKNSMLRSQISANRQLMHLGNQAAPLVAKGIANSGGARLAQSLAGELKNIRNPKTLIAGVAISSFFAADAAYSHFVGRDKAIAAGGEGAAMAVDAFTATTALAATSNLAYTVKAAVMPSIQRSTVAAANVKAASAMADDFLANEVASNKNTLKAGNKVAKLGPAAQMRGEIKKLGLNVKGTGIGGRVLKTDMKAALKEAAKVSGKANSRSPWNVGKKLAKAGSKLPGAGKVVGLAVVGGAAVLSMKSNSAQASTGDKQMKNVSRKSRSNISRLVEGGASAAIGSLFYKTAGAMGRDASSAAKSAKGMSRLRQQALANSRTFTASNEKIQRSPMGSDKKYRSARATLVLNQKGRAASVNFAGENRIVARQGMKAAKLSRMGSNFMRRGGHLMAANALYQAGNLAGQQLSKRVLGGTSQQQDNAGKNIGLATVMIGGITGYKASRSTKLAGRLIMKGASRLAGPAAMALTAYDVGKFVYDRHQQNEKVKAAPLEQRQAWADDKIKTLGGGEMKMRFDSFSAQQKSKFKTLDRGGRKAMLDQVDFGSIMASRRASSGLSDILQLDRSTPKAYLNDAARKKASATPAKKAGSSKTAATSGSKGTVSYTITTGKKKGQTVRMSAARAKSLRARTN